MEPKEFRARGKHEIELRASYNLKIAVVKRPKLVAVAGPLAGHSFAVPDTEACVGRAPYNWLSVRSPTVSRQHFQVEGTSGRWRVVDLDSRNGTYVNDDAVRGERWLEDGDRIRAGEAQFVFVVEDDENQQAPAVEDSGVQTKTILVFDGESTFLRPWLTESISERRLNALLRISALAQAVTAIGELREGVAKHISELMPPCEVQWEEHAELSERGILTEDEDWRGRVFTIRVPLKIGNRNRGSLIIHSKETLGRDHLDLATAVATLTVAGLETLSRVEQLERDNRQLRTESAFGHDLVGDSPAMERVYATIRKVAPTDTTVLLLGENGTGKELAARAIHRNSKRSAKPFVAVNCATLKEALMESELFGHEKGAFTGAILQKKGRIELADGGTLFLDEIGELETSLQAKLLRVLQEREYERLGGTRTIKADVRVIAATNRDLKEEVKAGRFREDLYYRLHVVSIRMPALRERKEDIPLLASHFMTRAATQCKKPIEGMRDAVREVLTQHDWPGNVRELQNTIERAVVLGSGEWIELEDLPESLLENPSPAELPAFHEAVRETKKQQILDAIQKAGGNISEAARILGVHPNYLHRLVTKLGLRSSIRSDRGTSLRG